MKAVSVIGYGRFGKLWADILSQKYTVKVYDISFSAPSERHLQFTTLDNALQSELVFLCIPISHLEMFLRENSSKFSESSIVIDTASVKIQPLKWMDEYIPAVPHIGIHPLFGPDSYKNGQNHDIILCPSTQYPNLTEDITNLHCEMGFDVKQISAEEHDRSISHSQGITHLIGNILSEMELKESITPTLGFKLLQSVETFCSNDTSQLFQDMLTYNPETSNIIQEFSSAFQNVLKTVEKNALKTQTHLKIGIMGVEGSFSHAAASQWLDKKNITSSKINYLTTAENVLSALDIGKIQVGFLALQNATGGVVIETIEALAKHNRINILEYLPFEVVQCLMKRKDNSSNVPDSIHSHPQALKQCGQYLHTHYPTSQQVKEEDTALSAKYLSENKLPENAFVIAPEVCASIYNLDIVKLSIQDLSYNPTDFVLIGKS